MILLKFETTKTGPIDVDTKEINLWTHFIEILDHHLRTQDFDVI